MTAPPRATKEGEADGRRDLFLAMNVSLVVGVLMLGLKMTAYLLTRSAAILSDAVESVVHIAAVGFAAYSLRLSYRPADANHSYGHAKIGFFSAGFEGGMIVLAALFIVFESVRKMIAGPELERLGLGIALTAAAVVVNGGLGGYLLWLGKKRRSLILEADGHHVLTDCWTSLGAIVALVLAMATSWAYWDPIFGILMALNILVAGYILMHKSVSGLMDAETPASRARIERLLGDIVRRRGVEFHELKVRPLGDRSAVEFHLLVPDALTVDRAHELATAVEEELAAGIDPRPYIASHIEPLSAHGPDHR